MPINVNGNYKAPKPPQKSPSSAGQRTAELEVRVTALEASLAETRAVVGKLMAQFQLAAIKQAVNDPAMQEKLLEQLMASQAEQQTP